MSIWADMLRYKYQTHYIDPNFNDGAGSSHSNVSYSKDINNISPTTEFVKIATFTSMYTGMIKIILNYKYYKSLGGSVADCTPVTIKIVDETTNTTAIETVIPAQMELRVSNHNVTANAFDEYGVYYKINYHNKLEYVPTSVILNTHIIEKQIDFLELK